MDGAFAIEDARVVAIARREAVSEHKRGHAPFVVSLGDLESFRAIHEHDVTSAGRYHHGNGVPLAFRRKKNRQERFIQDAIALRQGDPTLLPQRYFVVDGQLFASRFIRRHQGQDRERQEQNTHDASVCAPVSRVNRGLWSSGAKIQLAGAVGEPLGFEPDAIHELDEEIRHGSALFRGDMPSAL